MTTDGSGLAGESSPHVLRQYALLADGERGVLVGPRGDFAWMCVPRWDSEAIFAGLVGGRGSYTIRPDDDWFVWGGYYEHGSLIWRSRWVTSDGILECREALAFPGDPRRAVLLRRAIAVDRPMRMRVFLEPRAGFGRHRPQWSDRGALDDAGRTHVVGHTGSLALRWGGAKAARELPAHDGALGMRIDLLPGQCHDFVLEIADGELPQRPVDPDTAWRETELAWQQVLPSCDELIAPREARHAYAVLRGLTSSTGGMVAAATTSLPERAEEGRNYDYRYTWIRDQCFTGQGIAAHGPHPLVESAVTFVAERLLADGPNLSPAYTVTGETIPPEHTLSLPGYPGGVDTVGNRVRAQFQLDAFGEALLLFSAAARTGQLHDEGRRAVDVTVQAIEKRWRDTDGGIWELDKRRWAHSRLACSAGLRRAAEDVASTSAQASRWAQLADVLLADTAGDCVHESGRWQRSPGDPGVDAALLLAQVRGALPPQDPRSAATFDAVGKELTQDGYVYRFRHDDRPLGDAEGAFLLCNFVMTLAAEQRGETLAAFRWFERGRAACGPPGLYTEEFDATQRQLRANLPQAFVHGMLVECAARLPRDDLHERDRKR